MVDLYRARSDRLLLIRYEDLVDNTSAMLAGILDYLQLDQSDTILDPMLQSGTARQDHMTSAGVVRSMGKWRRELGPELMRSCNALFRDYHETFGYPAD